MEVLNENLISFIISPQFSGWLLILKIIFLVSSLFFLGIIVFSLFRSSWIKLLLLYDIVEFLTYRQFGVKKIEKIWNKIMRRLDMGLESEFKLAVIEADNMFDDILKKMGYTGETLGERLKKLTSATLPNIEQIKESHQVRNNIIHDPDYRLSLDETRKVLAVYEQAFRELEAF